MKKKWLFGVGLFTIGSILLLNKPKAQAQQKNVDETQGTVQQNIIPESQGSVQQNIVSTSDATQQAPNNLTTQYDKAQELISSFKEEQEILYLLADENGEIFYGISYEQVDYNDLSPANAQNAYYVKWKTSLKSIKTMSLNIIEFFEIQKDYLSTLTQIIFFVKQESLPIIQDQINQLLNMGYNFTILLLK